MKILIIAGPNGAGKTTFAREFLPNEADLPTFINADLIAVGLSPFRPEAAAVQAGRLMLETIADHVRRRQSFAFETTLSGLSYARMIPEWRALGYEVKLFFIRLDTPEAAVRRVRGRVSDGGHNVPAEDVRRRFDRGLENFEEIYKPLVDGWALYNGSVSPPALLEEFRND